MMRLISVLVLALSLFASPAAAVLPDEVLDDPALESRARELSLELRCLVCQNQSIDDSNAELARDLRLLVRERLVAGDTNEEAMAYIRARYGDFVLLRPPVQKSTYLLWFGPIGIVIAGVIIVIVTSRRRRANAAVAAPTAPLSSAERTRLDAALAREDDTGDRG
jgi:cytochrome c-type biogenesis protein CcmH